ncbi:MAG: SO2930 family diheme c-type cytochrome [Oligoflexales bacterium]
MLRMILILIFYGLVGLANKNIYAETTRFPSKLSDWNLFQVTDSKISLGEQVIPYSLKNPLFSDYASKYRTIRIPHGSKASYRQDGVLEFPVGSVISKTFGYRQSDLYFPEENRNPQDLPRNIGIGNARSLTDIYRIETRILLKEEKGWVGMPYVWNEDQNDASLALIGKKIRIKLTHAEIGQREFAYQVPNFNQCKACHVKYIEYSKPVLPIGPRAINLNHKFNYEEGSINQLEYWSDHDVLDGLVEEEKRPTMVGWDEKSAGVAARARAYLFANCAHCHRRQGPASMSGLFLSLDVSKPIELGICKTPVAVGNGGSRAMVFDIAPGDPEHSIMHYRLNSEDPAVMMPELGRSLIHTKGVALIYDWIDAMEGGCENFLLKD